MEKDVKITDFGIFAKIKDFLALKTPKTGRSL